MQSIDSDDLEVGFFRRHRIKLTVAILGGFGIFMLVRFGGRSGETFTPPPAPRIVSITVPPPPPPPPPKPREPRPETPREEQQMIAQETVTEPEEAPAEAPSTDAPLGTGITGDGPADGFGLGTKPGGGGFFGTRTGSGGGTGSRWGWYAGQVQTNIQTALSADPKTRSLALQARVRIWVAADGIIERVELSDPAATPSAIEAIRNALLGLKLRQAAPGDMPMPIVMRINARRPS